MKLDLGSGYIKRPGYTSVDIDKKVNPDIRADIRTLKPIKSNSVDEILCSHTLEHIYQKDLFKTLRTFNRILKPNGKITIIVPAIVNAVLDYHAGRIDYKKLDTVVLGNDQNATKYMLHKNIFTIQKIERYLLVTGFTEIETRNNAKTYETIATARKPNQTKNAEP